jgi:hypothetical protein
VVIQRASCTGGFHVVVQYKATYFFENFKTRTHKIVLTKVRITSSVKEKVLGPLSEISLAGLERAPTRLL